MAQQEFNVDRTTALYERPPMGAVDAATFTKVKKVIESSFAPTNVKTFLKSVERSGRRIRDFESILNGGGLGVGTAAEYAKLTSSDQGQVRELYLASLERVDLALREKFFKLYAYY